MLNDPNPSSPANVDASVEWRDRRAQFNERCQKFEYPNFNSYPDLFTILCRLAEKAKSEVPAGIAAKIPHPDTDPHQREKRAQKIKLLNAPMTTLDDDDDYGSLL